MVDWEWCGWLLLCYERLASVHSCRCVDWDRLGVVLTDASHVWGVVDAQGPMINAAGLEKVKRHVEDAVDKGAKVRPMGMAGRGSG